MDWFYSVLGTGGVAAVFLFGFWLMGLFRGEPNPKSKDYVDEVIKYHEESYAEYVVNMTAKFIKAWLYGIPIYVVLGFLFILE